MGLNTQNKDDVQNQKGNKGCGCEEPPLAGFFSFIGCVVGGIIGVFIGTGKGWAIFSLIGAVLFSGIYSYIHNYRKKLKDIEIK